ncbi:hypothetical protein [Mycobacterium sp. OTB74]|jgi:hypothetical protein|uniref:three-helix bundle dimerization domain-containing protein n=1 Tax=Mycobacterium sp. OTB74 TaxID=1853452 RepID=UPI0024744BBC|nr:hypothetical protein [Mycobacterium sp. OTB74]MDH6243829.1 (2Fe-2S) ferredoxin [Mycobacterium sp. OTB74]
MIALTEQQIIDEVFSRLVAKYKEVEPAEVKRIVVEQYARFEGRPVRDDIPLFVERHAKAELSKRCSADHLLAETVAQ